MIIDITSTNIETIIHETTIKSNLENLYSEYYSFTSKHAQNSGIHIEEILKWKHENIRDKTI